MLDQQISDVRDRAIAQIEAAATPEELERVRVEVLGRKGFLANVSKGFGKLSPEDRARAGKVLNAVKQELESAIEQKTNHFEADALNARLHAEWVDLTLPAPGPRRGSLHPVTII